MKTQPQLSAPAIRTIGLGQERAKAIQSCVQQHGLAAPPCDRAILVPDRRRKVITR